MADSKDFREEMQRIGQLVQEIELIADPAMKASTKNLVQSIMDLHGAAMERALEIVAAAGEQGLSIIRPDGQRSAGEQRFTALRPASRRF